ncbi:MAG: DUF167 domain-containing protein [Chloroflexota bacterium]
MTASWPPWMQVDGPDVLVRVKAVPGASRDAIAGALGDCLKVRVAAPPEGGKANASIAAMLAARAGIAGRDVHLETGSAQARKPFRLRAADPARVASLG